MTIRRIGLLLFGILGGVLVATGLYISAESSIQTSPPPMAVTKPTQPTNPKQAEPISLPVSISGTALMAMELSAYEGPFLEDGSDREVVDIAALVVYNAGSREIKAAQITLQYPDGLYHFYGENLPAGGTVVLLEQNARVFRRDTILGCTGWQMTDSSNSITGEQITLTENENDGLSIKNLTDRPLHNIHIYYKSWLSPPDYYMGGISYCLVIPSLWPGQEMALYPGHYAAGYTKVVSVTADSQ